MPSFRLSLGQMDIALGKPDENFERVREWTAEAAGNDSALVVFPELWSTGYDLENWPTYASKLGEGMFAQLSELAAEFKIAIAGSIMEAKNGKCYNSLALFDAEGGQRAVYRKVHLFRLMEEEKWLAPGEESVIAEAAWGPTGLGICYDLRFSELFRKYALNGAKMIILPAEWPGRRAYHWQTLLRARAIENQMFVVGVNRVGESKGEQFGGGSAVIDPWGEAVAEGGSDPALLHAEIDLGMVDEVRKRIPVFEDRRPDVY
ncbi:MAG TPA: carbon-nitrogen family hydrolase [Anaerolineales bacterium]|nr:carbon-nitrogen family hydrolase [Anaerolineales bacterium]